jgi:murein DD-endopeptidase MepM/ murein hydrolase activator NlpD
MKQLFKKFGWLVILAILMLPFASADTITAQSNNGIVSIISDSVSVTQESDSYEKVLKRIKFLQNIKNQMNATRSDYRQITDNVQEASGRIAEIHVKVTTLKDQIRNLDDQIETTKSLITNVTIQITEKENTILVLYDEMEIKKAAIEEQKKLLSEYLKAIYEEENSVTDTINGNEEISIAKLLLSDIPVGEQLQQIKYFNIMEATGHRIFARLEQFYLELLKDQKQIEIDKTKLQELNAQLAEQEDNLKVDYQAKLSLLALTHGQETIYAVLLDESMKQQEQLAADLTTLSDNLDFIERKMVELGDSFNPDDYSAVFDNNTTSVAAYIRETKDNDGSFQPNWPVSPSRGITAYFRDASYKSYFGFAHNAVDVRTPQGTNIRAPADGVVYKVQDNGYGYSYLIIAHEGGYMTVYGHVTGFRVEEGEKIREGQIIALSGGTPGTKGAGLMTTGAHLHFEILKEGKYVDPLDYLPLSLLPMKGLPSKYAARVTGVDRKVQRLGDEEIKASNDEELTKIIENGVVGGNTP